MVRWVEWGFPAAVLALALVEVAVGQITGGPAWARYASALLVSLPLYARTRHPWITLAVVLGTIVGANLIGVNQDNYTAEIIAGVTATYSLAARRPVSHAIAGSILAVAACLVTVVDPVDVGSAAWIVLILGGPALAGAVIRDRRLLIERLESTTADLEAGRVLVARAAADQERTRIARELHDVVAHAVSVIVVQAGAAEKLVGADDDRARASLRAVGDSGREALGELRRLLAVLRTDDPDAKAGPDLTPQPGLAGLDRLVEPMARAGITVRIERSGTSIDLPRGVDLTAYRIVQEALTNVVKHAGADQVDVRLRFGVGDLDLRIDDNGNGGPSPHHPTGSGSGLTGMRERAASCGGVVVAGPRPDGGFRVSARLPLGAAV